MLSILLTIGFLIFVSVFIYIFYCALNTAQKKDYERKKRIINNLAEYNEELIE